MLPALRCLSLRPELPSKSPSIRRFIHTSLCASGPSPSQLGVQTLLDSGMAHDNIKTLHPESGNPTNGLVSLASGAEISGKNRSPDVKNSDRTTKSAKSRKAAEQDMSDETVSTRTSKAKKPPRKLVEPPAKKIEAFLQKVESEKDTLILADVERYSPPTIPDTRSPRYEAEYTEVMNNLIRSFSMLNMRKIFDLYKLPHLPLSRQKKIPYAQAILQHWGWTPIAVIRDWMLDETKASELRFPVRSEEAFLLMGKDGAELLRLAKRFAVNLSFSDQPMALQAKGLQGSLKRLAGYLKGFKKDIQSETTSLPLGQPLSFETIKSISRLSGAYLTPEKDKFRVFFHKSQPWTSKIAQYLAVQASSGQTADTNQAIYIPSLGTVQEADNSSSAYSLYPFSPHQSLSWKIPSSSIFRLRRVGHWLDTVYSANDLAKRDEDFNSSILFDNSNTDVKTQLLGQLSPSLIPYSSLVVSACAGHFLFLSSASQEQTLVPPMIGDLNPTDIFRWTQRYPDRTAFQPSIPTSILTSPADKDHHVRKLIYVEQTMRRHHSSSGRTLNLEIPQKSKDGQENEECKPLCYLSKQINVNVLIPDRFTDIQFSTADVHEILPSQFPIEFLSYIARVESGSQGPQELAPFELEFDGVAYALNSDTYIHREFKKSSLHDMRINVLVETHVDAGIGQNTAACKILCEDHSTEGGWQDFLKQCNMLTIAS